MFVIVIQILFILVMQPEGLESFLTVEPNSDFPLENIPFGVSSLKTTHNQKFCSTRIGNFVINLQQIENHHLFDGQLYKALNRPIFNSDSLNDFMALSKPYWTQIRLNIQKLFSNQSKLKQDAILQNKIVFRSDQTINHLPAKIGDYTDFYSSRSHAFNVGSIMRGPENALNENWLHIPIGYHGRSSSIVVSGTPLTRPRGQVKAKDAKVPSFSDCKRLDFEVQIGVFLGGTPNELGKPIKVNQAWDNIFGLVILNDWSFRDFQAWEYVPLGPFTAKNGMSTISPWIVTLDALSESKVKLPEQDPIPLEYLQEKDHVSYDIKLEVGLKTNKMQSHVIISTTNYKYMYWSAAQQLAHHAVSGCNMRAGDMLGSGTISGEAKHQYGSLLQLTWGGQNAFTLSNGEARKFLEDGDSLTINGFANVAGKRIGFGNCEGTILPARPLSDYY